MAAEILSVERLRSVIDYNPETGVFIRKVRLAQRHHAGDRADTVVNGGNLIGYRRVSLFGERHLAHRLAWFYVHGVWPKKHLDHINGIKGDNRIENLREADDQLNIENLRKAKVSNKGGLLGAHWHEKNKNWVARIQIAGKTFHIGVFKTPEEAHEAYVRVKRKNHKGCTL